MQPNPDQSITVLLQAVDAGDADAVNKLLPLVYEQLRGLADSLMRREQPGQTIQATALVHEAYMRLADGETNWKSQRHFFNTAALVMRRILVDRARRQNAVKHGGGQKREQIDVINIPAAADYSPEEIDGLDMALDELTTNNARWGEIVHLRFFIGLTIEQTAEILDVSPATVKSDWQFAKAWLKVRIDRAG
tara:strand:- start:43599 stop:44174 length:576 start_codon:yes stop_codon:yes gene_type:complete